MDKSLLVIVSGSSGTGKTTIMRNVMDNEIVSFTTRPKRPNEIDGLDYLFITPEEFKNHFDNDNLVEHTTYADNNYGMTKTELYSKLKLGNVFTIVDVYGMKQLKEIYDNCVTIFLYAPYEDVKSRMELRGDNSELIEKRLSTYEEEYENRKYYDYIVRNKQGKVDYVTDVIHNIIMAEL